MTYVATPEELGPETVTTLTLEGSGWFAFCDPCELDDGFGGEGRIEEMAQMTWNSVRFAAGQGRYLLHVRESDVSRWGKRVVGVELVPADLAVDARDWQSIGWVSIDTATLAVFDPERLARQPFSFDELFGDSAHLFPSTRPCLASVSTGFGDGGYDVEVDGPLDAVRAVRVTFIEVDADADEEADDETDDALPSSR